MKKVIIISIVCFSLLNGCAEKNPISGWIVPESDIVVADRKGRNAVPLEKFKVYEISITGKKYFLINNDAAYWLEDCISRIFKTEQEASDFAAAAEIAYYISEVEQTVEALGGEGRKTVAKNAGKPEGEKYLQYGGLFLRSGKYEESIKAYKLALHYDYEKPYNVYYNIACAWSLLGETDKSLEYLEKSISEGFSDYEYFHTDSDLENVRKTSGFNELMEQSIIYRYCRYEHQKDSSMYNLDFFGPGGLVTHTNGFNRDTFTRISKDEYDAGIKNWTLEYRYIKMGVDGTGKLKSMEITEDQPSWKDFKVTYNFKDDGSLYNCPDVYDSVFWDSDSSIIVQDRYYYSAGSDDRDCICKGTIYVDSEYRVIDYHVEGEEHVTNPDGTKYIIMWTNSRKAGYKEQTIRQ